MNQKDIINKYLQFANSLIGKKIITENVTENIQFAKKSNELAKRHEWLYHCTTASALKSIIANREFWLSNITIVNDNKEKQRIDVPEYRDKCYIGCFTYNPQIPEEHWDEYGSITEGVLVGVKKEWFVRKAIFMTSNNIKCNHEIIAKKQKEALCMKVREQERGRIINPFYIEVFKLYEVIYDDNLEKKMEGTALMELNGVKKEGRTITPEVAGIIKSTHGISGRSGKDRDWTKEKEVRLKVLVRQLEMFENGNEIHDGMIIKGAFPKIAVPVSDDAFNILKIGFSPKFDGKDAFIEEMRTLLPQSEIEVLGI